MAAVHSLRVSVKSDCGSEHSDSGSDSSSDRDARESEPMEVEEGELDTDDITVNRSLKELIPDTTRRYENKAGTFITGIDVNSKEAIEAKEKRAQRFRFSPEVIQGQRNVVLDMESVMKAIPTARLEAIYMIGVDDMSTQDIFGYFREYPPAHIEWIDDTSCNVVWLDDVTSFRVLINTSVMPDPEAVATETEAEAQSDKPAQTQSKGVKSPGAGEAEEEEVGEEEEGEVNEGEKAPVKVDSVEVPGEPEKKTEVVDRQVDQLSEDERESLLRNDLRPATKPFKGNKLLLRIATHDDKKELGAARRSRYYMKYGNPNYGGMKGILSNSWKRRFHTRRIQRDVIKTDLVNLPEEPIKEEEEEEEEEEDDLVGEEDMEADDRVVEYRDRACGRAGPAAGGGGVRARIGVRRGSPAAVAAAAGGSSDSDEMDYDLELKMISTPSPKKSMKMTMYADELETELKTIRHSVSSDSGSGSSVQNRIGDGGGALSEIKVPSVSKVTDVRQLLEEKRQGHRAPARQTSPGKMDVRQRLGKRRRSPSPVSPRDSPPSREPVRDIHSRLGITGPDARARFSTSPKDRKNSRLWSRLGPSQAGPRDKAKDDEEEEEKEEKKEGGRSSSSSSSSRRKSSSSSSSSRREGTGVFSSSRLGSLPDDDGGGGSRSSRRSSGNGGRKAPAAREPGEPEEEDDQALQQVWGALIKQKQDHRGKKSRLENLPSLQIEISRDSDSQGSDSDS
ncbi:nuclear cap-binding protein subunit 3 isoform X1 [Gadus morhua]|uniref:Nuclear cap-binding protein subunit 3 n=1 Tax=Gadus morhua TaxID=8049 RepID=A0A8C5FIJ5_GADMO|nr:nuclear cap-binding protein subunit 3 isoform X1 [Gadus morhua]